jgi:AraC family transcriptional regulator
MTHRSLGRTSDISEAVIVPEGLANDGVRRKNLARREEEWRARPEPLLWPDGRPVSVLLSKWSDLSNGGTYEVISEHEYDDHVLTLRIRRKRGEMRMGGRRVWSGSDAPGKLFMTGPKQSRWTAVVHGRYDNLRVFLPQTLLSECYENAFGKQANQPIVLFDSSSVEDDALWQMMNVCNLAGAHDEAVALSLIDSLGIAIASRVLALHYRIPTQGGSGTVAMAGSSFRKMVEYIDSHLAMRISLSNLSEITGLNRFRLTEEFKTATGFAPYAYILRRRIHRAKELLAGTGASLAGVALEVGFGSQAHFTDSFRKIVGTTPGEWRKART